MSKVKEPCWEAILNKEESRLDILLHEEIGFWGVQSKEFAKLLIDNKDVKDIYVDINCRGGSCSDGFSIYNFLVGHKAKKHIKVSGTAASMASVILMAGDNNDSAENGVIMMHKPWVPYTSGDADQLRKNAESLDKLELGIIKAYQKRLDKTDSEIAKMLKDTTYLTADEAKEMNIVDVVSEEIPVLNKFDFDAYGYSAAPESIRKMYDKNYKPENTPPDNNILNKIAKLLNLKKEPDSMADKELQKNFDTLSEKFTALEKKFTDKEAADKVIIEDRGKVIKNLTDQIASNAVNSKKNDLKSYCQGLVKEGKMKPVAVDVNVDVLHERLEKDKASFTEEKQETPLFDSYKNLLGSAPVMYDTSGDHFADKDNAVDGGSAQNEAKLQAEIDKLVKESGMAEGKAYQAVLRDHPEWR